MIVDRIQFLSRVQLGALFFLGAGPVLASLALFLSRPWPLELARLFALILVVGFFLVTRERFKVLRIPKWLALSPVILFGCYIISKVILLKASGGLTMDNPEAERISSDIAHLHGDLDLYAIGGMFAFVALNCLVGLFWPEPEADK